MPDLSVTTRSRSAGQTERLAARLAETLMPGDVVLIAGDLGAGKTTFVRGAARALGVVAPVTSPTFTIGHIYEAGLAQQEDRETDPSSHPLVTTVSHLDLYRLATLDGEDPDLLADYVGDDTVAFVEWPAGGEQQLQQLASVAYRVTLDHAGGDDRAVTITDLRDQGRRA